MKCKHKNLRVTSESKWMCPKCNANEHEILSHLVEQRIFLLSENEQLKEKEDSSQFNFLKEEIQKLKTKTDLINSDLLLLANDLEKRCIIH